MQDFIFSLNKAINENELPGEEAHLQLMPENRIIYKELKNKTNAGVLLLIYPNEKGIYYIVFIKRSEYSGHHSKQISFPGGKEEIGDNSLEFTALRESKEEIGIEVEQVQVLGRLSSLFIPISNFLVFPYVGVYNTPPTFRIDKSEVDYLIEYPVLNLTNLKIKYFQKIKNGIPYVIPYFDINDEIIWGATSMILNELIQILSKSVQS